MNSFNDLWGMFATSLQSTLDRVLGFIPNLVMAVVVIMVGWLVAFIVQRAFGRLFQLIGLDRMGQKSGLHEFMASSGIRRPVSWILSRILFWAVILITLLPISDILKLGFFAELVNTLVSYLPNVFVALLVIVIGTWAARVLSGIARGNLVRLGEEAANVVSLGVQVVTLVISFIIALAQLRIDSSILTSLTLIIVGALGVGLAIALAIGSRDLIRNVLAGVYINNSFQIGNDVKMQDLSGKLTSIGLLSSVVETGDGKKLTIPNSAFMDVGVQSSSL